MVAVAGSGVGSAVWVFRRLGWLACVFGRQRARGLVRGAARVGAGGLVLRGEPGACPGVGTRGGSPRPRASLRVGAECCGGRGG